MQQRSSDDLACFDVRRDDWTARQNPQVYFDDVETGVHCASTDWYAGSIPTDNHGNVQAEAAALLGFDGDIERYCWDVAGHVNAECDRANMHILQLMEGDIKWNICRNFEWQVCAAKGLLSSKQRARKIRFAFQPSDLWLSGHGESLEFGVCGGVREDTCDSDETPGFGNDDVFFLEVCLFSQVCSNGAELFRLNDYEDFVCDFSTGGFDHLRRLLLEGPNPGDFSFPEDGSSPSDSSSPANDAGSDDE